MNDDAYTDVAQWWRNTLDHRFFTVVEWDNLADFRLAVIDDFGDLVRVLQS